MERPADGLNRDGVVLRRWRVDEAGALHRAVAESFDHLVPWMPWAVADYAERDALEYLVRAEHEWATGEAFAYRIVAADGVTAGSCSLMARIGPGGLEIGYWLRPGYTGRGIATIATAALVDEAFRVGADRVEIVHDAANVRSAAIPARLGFTEVERLPRGDEPDTRIEVRWRLSARSGPRPGPTPQAPTGRTGCDG